MSENLQKKAVEKAIKFLQAAGASYTIDFGEEKYTNKKVRPDYKSVYQPLIDQAVQDKQSCFTIQVPEGMDPQDMRSALAGTLSRQFGTDNTMTEVNMDKHTIDVLFIQV